MDVINPHELCVNLFKGFDFTGVKLSIFPIGNWRRRYNSVALPRSLWCWLLGPYMRSPLMEAGSSNLALLHCSCLCACLAAYSNILRRDLNTTCITIICGCDVVVVEPISERADELGGFWSKPSLKV